MGSYLGIHLGLEFRVEFQEYGELEKLAELAADCLFTTIHSPFPFVVCG